MSHVIDARELASVLASGAPVRVLDVRWRLDLPEGRPAYLDGHVPGAVYVDLERELAEPGHPEEGRHPLPPVHALEAAARRWGLREGDVVVAYDDLDGVAAARVWWLLRGYGVEVRVLDGGIRQWARSGQLVESGDVAPRRGDIVLRGAGPDVATIDEAALVPDEGLLIDVRSPSPYRGHAAGTDPVAGHIPGAVNLPTLAHIDERGHVRPAADIVAALRSVGYAGQPVTLYCSSGIAAAHSAFALATAGIDARVYPGSWSQWSRSAGRPVAVGPTPDGDVRGGRGALRFSTSG